MTRPAPLWEGLTKQWLGAGRTQERSQDCAAADAQRLRPGASPPLHNCVAAVFQGLWKVTTDVWHQASPLMTLFQHQQMWWFSGVCWDWVATEPLPNAFPAVELLLPCNSPESPGRFARGSPRPHSAPGDLPFPPEHRQVSSCRVSDSVIPVYKVLMEFKPSPFSLFSSVPAAVSTFLLSLQLLLLGGGMLFPNSPTPLPLHPFSTSKNSSLPSAASLSSSSPLRAMYLLSSVVQVMLIVVLILRSVF